MTTNDSTHGETQLLPCPFCGWERPQLVRAVINGERELVESPFVRCLECGTIGPPHEDGDDTHAVQLWNSRVTPPPSPETEEAKAHEELDRDIEYVRRVAREGSSWESIASLWHGQLHVALHRVFLAASRSQEDR